MKRVAISLFCLLVLFSHSVMAYEKEINAMSATMAEKIAASGKKTIAVVDFTDLQGNVTELGRFLAEEFSVSLADAGKGFEVVDRTHLKSIIREHNLSSTGIIDSSTARQLGKIAGVESLITGTLTPFGDTIRIAVKILDTETAKIIGASRTNLAKTGALVDLISTGIDAQGGATTSSVSKTSAAQPLFEATTKEKSQIMKTETKNGIKCELKSCKLKGSTLTFGFIMTSIDKDKLLQIHCNYNNDKRSRLFDNNSNEFSATLVKLADKSGGGAGAKHLLLKDLPTGAEVVFENVPNDAKFVAMLELDFWDHTNWKHFEMQFRNIPITK